MKSQRSARVETGQCCVRQQKGFLNYVNRKRRFKKNIEPILVAEDHLTNRPDEKLDVFNAFVASVFSINYRPWAAWSSYSEDHNCRKSDFPFADTEFVRDYLYQLNVHKFMGPHVIHPRVLKELVDVTAGLLSIIYQRSWESGEIPADWKLANVITIYKKGERTDPQN